ncbi:MAG: hypothetical protein P0Y64_18045 [Candidatus Sphingomonas colombiensis]|nr:hypothetical protein [Sphingomonas sp.]WEK43199.1 MAG: hypothetical protein P0Y64_18045 [Sphingomonas sp.]
MKAICCSLNLDVFIHEFPRSAPAKPNREFLTKFGPVSGVQVTDTLRNIVGEIGCQAAFVTEAPASSDIAVLTVPLTAAFALPPRLLDGRVVVDANNYYPDRDGRIDALEQRETTTAQMIASHFVDRG